MELGLEEWVGFKCDGCNSTSHGKKVEMEEKDTWIVSKKISLLCGENMLNKGMELSLIP